MSFDATACREHSLYVNSADGFELFYYGDKRTVKVQTPEKARVGSALWSPDGSMLAFFAHFEDATHIYIADTETGFSRKVTTTPVLATLATSFQWSKDGKQIQTILLPDDGKREVPKPDPVSSGPKVRMTRGGNNPSRTYRYLLESPYDMKLLEHLATGQLALIDIRDGKVTKIGCPNMIRSVSMAPGESQFRVATIKKPFSYFVPFINFGSTEGIWNNEGKSLYVLNDRNLRDTEPQPALAANAAAPAQTGTQGARRGAGQGTAPAPATKQDQPPVDPQPNPMQPNPDQPPVDPDAPQRPRTPVDPDAKRDISWRPDGIGLSYLQMEPVKKDSKEPRKDRLHQWLPPYRPEDAKVIYETPNRITSVQYTEDCHMVFLTQMVDSQRQIMAIDLKDPKTPYVIYKSGAAAAPTTPITEDAEVADEDEQQPGRGPGGGRGGAGGTGAAGGTSLMTKSSRGEVPVVRVSSTGDVYMTGSDRTRGMAATPPKPYLDKINIKTGKKTRIFEGKAELTETIDAVDGDDVKLVFTTRQSKDVVPDSFVTELQSGKSTKLTNNVDPAPWSHQLKVDRFQVTRVDGFKFWVKVTTPPKHDGKLPALFLDLSSGIRQPGCLQRRCRPRSRWRGRPWRRRQSLCPGYATRDDDADAAGLRRSGTGCANRRPGGQNER